MVRLKNIKKTNELIECDIVPEDSESAGHIVTDFKKGKLINYSLPVGYEWCISHVMHASDNLVELSKEKEIPSTLLVMWC